MCRSVSLSQGPRPKRKETYLTSPKGFNYFRVIVNALYVLHKSQVILCRHLNFGVFLVTVNCLHGDTDTVNIVNLNYIGHRGVVLVAIVWKSVRNILNLVRLIVLATTSCNGGKQVLNRPITANKSAQLTPCFFSVASPLAFLCCSIVPLSCKPNAVGA